MMALLIGVVQVVVVVAVGVVLLIFDAFDR